MARAERRIETRQRTRLRPGKLFCVNGRFLADAAILDLSVSGIRLKMFEAVPDAEALIVLDEREIVRWQARRIWSDGGLCGFLFEARLEAPQRREMMQLAGPYYAILENDGLRRAR